MKRVHLLFVLIGLALAPLALEAQTPQEQGEDFASELFPPELIMRHRRAIGLTDEQRDAITRMIQDLQGRVVALQWRLLDEMQSLTETLETERVDLDRALDRLEQTLETEMEIKRANLELLIRIKNVLRPDQQQTLKRLRGEEAGNGPGRSDANDENP